MESRAVDDLDPHAAVAALEAAPLWRYFGDVLPVQPQPLAVPDRWRYTDLRPHLMHFLGALGLDEAERRVLMLVNPGMTQPRRPPRRCTPGCRSSARA